MRRLFRAFVHPKDGGGGDRSAKIRIGICAMDKKVQSKPMREVLRRLNINNEFEIIPFGDQMILERPIEEWPAVEALLSWHSDGFPLAKAQAYVAKTRPFCVNDIAAQDLLLDRRQVYKILQENSIPVPTHIVVDRDKLAAGEDPVGFVEEEDYVELNGRRIYKPFVEKPASGEDHNIYIYYPHSMGGGVKRLFRKVNDKSSQYDPEHSGNVRRDGSYMYEEFLPTGGTDVKVYTVGPRYAHAEARKSPVVDGRVLRTPDGKEVRFPVLLSPQEKEIARMVSLAFGQKVCGFDLLRSEKGRSYVCDVNGWSFVKNSQKYYDDAAGILRSIILSALAPHRLTAAPAAAPTHACTEQNAAGGSGGSSSPLLAKVSSFQELVTMGANGVDEEEARRTDERSHQEELRCVLAVIRHGDRTPKQKMKVKVTQAPLLELFMRHRDSKGKQAKLKTPNQLQELLDITRQLLQQMERGGSADESARDAEEEIREKFRIVRTVLEQGGHFSGINRKVQLKPLRWGVPEPAAAAADCQQQQQQQPVLEEALLILKWGGVLTHAGRRQAEDLGRVFRMVMYPSNGTAGGGLLRLHSTYRHDFKIYSSDEGRVQTSAAAFTKGLLDLEGTSLTPILVSLVQKDASMLDAFGKGASEDIRAAKHLLYQAMTWDPERAGGQPLLLQPLQRLLSPPHSPKAISRSSSGNSAVLGAAAAYSGQQQQQQQQQPAPPSLAAATAAVGNGSFSSAHSFPFSSSTSSSMHDLQAAGGGQSQSQTDLASHASVTAADIKGMPDNPFKYLQQLVSLMRQLVHQLRELCLAEGAPDGSVPPRRFSSMSQDPKEWGLDPSKPCSGEKPLLMFDRWQKLLKSFYSDKKQSFDISKVPDIYDSAKYDAIHNKHLGLPLQELYAAAKALAAAVIPNEYGIDPQGKLRIGGKICGELLGKLLADMASMREESIATAQMEAPAVATASYDKFDRELGRLSLLDEQMLLPTGLAASPNSSRMLHPGIARTVAAGGNALGADTSESDEEGRRRRGGKSDGKPGGGGADGELDEADLAGDCDEDFPEEPETIHRLCPTYASDINSPLRHVRTRIYFTSESHIHSLVNVLRYCHIRGGPAAAPLLGPDGCRLLDSTMELDYLTHVVFRMYENKTVPVDHPERFRVEVLFSPGANYSPFEVEAEEEHVLPTMPRAALQPEEHGASLASMEALMAPLVNTRKWGPCSYALQVGLKAPLWRSSSGRSARGSTADEVAARIG